MSNQQHRARCTATRQVTINDGYIILTERQNAFDPARAPDDQEGQRAKIFCYSRSSAKKGSREPLSWSRVKVINEWWSIDDWKSSVRPSWRHLLAFTIFSSNHLLLLFFCWWCRACSALALVSARRSDDIISIPIIFMMLLLLPPATWTAK